MSGRSVLSDFLTHVGDEFLISNSEGVTLKLSSGSILKDGFANEVADPTEATNFSLIFLGPPNTSFQQGMYELNHAVLGEKSLFLVPVGLKDGCTELEAIFTTAPESSVTP